MPAQDDRDFILAEVRKCRADLAYFVDTYCQVISEQDGKWVPFRLWAAQEDALRTVHENRLVVILKSRQVGLTWAVLAYCLWLLLLHPARTILMFSRRDDEAVDLLRNRLKEMHKRLPPWLQASRSPIDNDHEWAMLNGSRVRAFPCTAGDSYTASLVVVDEADLIPDLDRLLRAVKPTTDAGGKLVLLSRADKGTPESPFKRAYRAAVAGGSGWTPVFLPWSARPGRDQAWYDAQRADVLARTGSLDALHEQYPATDAEALAPRSLDKRIAPEWALACYREAAPLGPDALPDSCPSVPGLVVYAAPVPGRLYAVGADPAEGNPNSDDSALEVIDCASGEQVCSYAGRLQPSAFAGLVNAVGSWYNSAPALVERNNHGHAVLLWLEGNGRVPLLPGLDGRAGWLSSAKGKAVMYASCADAFRLGEVSVRCLETLTQLQSIEGATLRAPDGAKDDRADAWALAITAALTALSSMVDQGGGDSVAYT